MPRAPKRCASCGTSVVARTYCPDCQPVGWVNGASRTSTAEHKAWAAQVKAAARGLCQIRGPRCTTIAVHADHVVPVGEGGAALDPANGQAACEPCHKAKTQREAARGRARRRRTTKPPEHWTIQG